MMPKYHIGTLSTASRELLLSGPDTPAETESSPRPTFLQSKVWSKALLASKKIISSDTRIFSFTLEHSEQTIGLPIGQHLMMRLRDPVTREAIIRSYTPISEGSEKGILNILIKVYFDSVDREGGKMTKALDSLPLGHPVDFKGPIGKFEYLGNGECKIGGKLRTVKRFIMICAGSGVTPIFQVLRAVMQDKSDPTKCIVLDGNRAEEDILCRAEIDQLAQGNEHKATIIHTLTKPTETWTGLKGRVGTELLAKEVGTCLGNGEDLILICGPENLEKSVHSILGGLGWKDEDLLFF